MKWAIGIGVVLFLMIIGSCGSDDSSSEWELRDNGYYYNQDGYCDDNGNGHFDEDDLYGNGKSWNYLD